MPEIAITPEAISRRRFWVDEIRNISGNFAGDCQRLEAEIISDLQARGPEALQDHLRLCGTIPESYGHDSSEEKLYSKYTDIVVACAFRTLGLTSVVLTERSDAADVECLHKDFSFVADAKAFRLTRTARNVKDFKVQAMHGWKGVHLYAIVVSPLHQLPSTTSQIYQQAINRDVCIFSFSHLSLLISLARDLSGDAGRTLLLEIFKMISSLHPSKSASDYWQAINKRMIEFDPKARELWQMEKMAASEALSHSKQESVTFLSGERRRILGMDHQQAIQSLLEIHRLDKKKDLLLQFEIMV